MSKLLNAMKIWRISLEKRVGNQLFSGCDNMRACIKWLKAHNLADNEAFWSLEWMLL